MGEVADTQTSAASGARIGNASNSFLLRSSPSLNSVRLRRIFDTFDKNGDGMITAEEMNLALSSLGLDANFDEVESMINSHVPPGKRGLEFADFAVLHSTLDKVFFEGKDLNVEVERERQEESDLKAAFNVFDEDGDGFISAWELQEVLEKLGMPEAREMERVRQMIVAVDVNYDGHVDFVEFKDMMRRVLVQDVPSS